MKSSSRLQRKTPLVRESRIVNREGPVPKLARSGPIESHRTTNPARSALNLQLEVDPRACQLGPGFARHGLHLCAGRATCWHELRKRSSQGSILNPANLMASCVPCNDLVECEPDVARSLGYVLREGDPTWLELGQEIL